MNINCCEVCGLRVSEAALASGRTKRVDDAHYCLNCLPKISIMDNPESAPRGHSLPPTASEKVSPAAKFEAKRTTSKVVKRGHPCIGCVI